MPTYAVTIAGVAKSLVEGSLRIHELLNGRNVLACRVRSTDGTYRPAMGAEILITADGTRIFGGHVTTPRESGVPSGLSTAQIETAISAADFNALPDRRIVTASRSSETLLARLQALDDYLTPYGVTLAAGQVTGPTVPARAYVRMKLTDVLNELSVVAGDAASTGPWPWEVDYNKSFEMFQPGTRAAPFAIAEGDGLTIGDVSVEQSREDYANRIIVEAGSGEQEVTDERHNGTGTARRFALNVTVAQLLGVVSIYRNGVFEVGLPVGVYGVDDIAWTFDSSTNELVQKATETVLAAIDHLLYTYIGAYPVVVQADDAAEQAAQGIWEKVIFVADLFDYDQAVGLAEGLLAVHVITRKIVRYRCRTLGLHPGQTQAIVRAGRNVSGDHLITEVKITNPSLTRIDVDVTAISGAVLPKDWRDIYRAWGGQSVAAPSVVSVGTGTTTVLSSPFSLGGSRNTSIAPSPAAWTPLVNWNPYVAAASFSARVRVTLRARTAGVSAQARLRNTTDSTSQTSSVVTSTSETEVTFGVSIVSGKTYRLEVLNGTAGEGVYAIGQLEAA